MKIMLFQNFTWYSLEIWHRNLPTWTSHKICVILSRSQYRIKSIVHFHIKPWNIKKLFKKILRFNKTVIHLGWDNICCVSKKCEEKCWCPRRQEILRTPNFMHIFFLLSFSNHMWPHHFQSQKILPHETLDNHKWFVSISSHNICLSFEIAFYFIPVHT